MICTYHNNGHYLESFLKILVWLQVEAALTNEPDSEELKKLKTDLEVP